jgi:hypothetical protein
VRVLERHRGYRRQLGRHGRIDLKHGVYPKPAAGF